MLPPAVSRLLSAQAGCAHRRQLLAAGLPAHRIDRLRAAGTWVEVQRNVYAPAGVPGTHLLRCSAAVLAVVHAGDADADGARRVAVIGRSAAALQFAGWPEPRIVTLGTASDFREVALVDADHSRLRTWPQHRFTVIAGLMVASPADTIVHLAPSLRPAQLIAVVQQQTYARATTTTEIRRRLGRGISGSVALRKACLDVDVGFESLTAKRAIRALQQGGIDARPGIRLAHGMGISDFVVAGRLRGRTYGLAGEIDGPHHDGPDQQARDERRDAAVERFGYTPRRWRAELVAGDLPRFVAEVRAEVDAIERTARRRWPAG